MDSKNKEVEMIDKGGIKIPKLDFSSIYIQREVVSSHNDNDEDSDGENESFENENGEEESGGGDSKNNKEKFEKQKQAFKQKMLSEFKWPLVPSVPYLLT